MDLNKVLDLLFYLILAVLLLSVSGLIIVLYLHFRGRNKSTRKLTAYHSNTGIAVLPQSFSFSFSEDEDENDEINMRTYRIEDIPKSNHFSAYERKIEYRRRGKSPSGVIDGVYNDMYREDGHSYNNMDRDWDADA